MLKELILKNRSYRGYDESVRVTREQLMELADCARLAPSSQNFQPLKYYLSCDAETNAKIQPLTGWARQLQPIELPHPGHCPTGFIVICYDSDIGPGAQRFAKDVGIAAQTMLLAAAEMGLGGCMIGNFSPAKLSEALALPERLQPVLVVAIGKPDERVVLTELEPGGSTDYYRDEDDVHYVPKRRLEDVIIN
ncbi:MAG: nitroreductase family protein [Clostridia bacterium]|nr:nitroreductase family protein [Clostridia bacterium]